eukprot:1151440-Pelagomonas_calceolata.AAC.6
MEKKSMPLKMLCSCSSAPSFACSAPTLILSECVLVYMEPSDSSNLIRMLGQTFSNAAIVVYEQVWNYAKDYTHTCARSRAAIWCILLANSPTVPRQAVKTLRFVATCQTMLIRSMASWTHEMASIPPPPLPLRDFLTGFAPATSARTTQQALAVRPHDAFGRQMRSNLEERGCPLLGLTSTPTLEAHCE